jgi:pSer/pThr/pTyr-binding forkhead associated (FHA) protein
MDLESTNKSFLNGEELEEARYYELREQDVLKFGESTREYVIMKK